MVSTRLQSTTGGDGEGRGVKNGVNVPQVSNDLIFTTNISVPSPPYVSNAHFLDLPSDCMENIFSYLGYKQVSQLRLVSRQLDRVCSAILNSTFQKLQTQMLHRFQGIKAKMPRRESARRNHPLACESDIIETLHMRLTLLQMSFGKHIERKHVCFFAGEILDEVYRILHYIKVTPKLARPYKVTDELFDLSTMAMEYFKEHIEPTLPEIAYFGTDFLDFTSTSNKYMSLDSPPHGIGKGDESPTTTQSDDQSNQRNQSNMVLRKRIRKIKQGMKRYTYQLNQIRKDLRHNKSKLAEHQKQLCEYATRMDENEKKTEEANRKFSTMLQELNKCKTELQYWRSKSPLSSLCLTCGGVTAQMPDEVLNHPHPMMMPELEPAPAPAFMGPSTSSPPQLEWNLSAPNSTPARAYSPEQRNKRKSSTADKAPTGGPAAKKRNVLKSRTKRI